MHMIIFFVKKDWERERGKRKLKEKEKIKGSKHEY